MPDWGIVIGAAGSAIGVGGLVLGGLGEARARRAEERERAADDRAQRADERAERSERREIELSERERRRDRPRLRVDSFNANGRGPADQPAFVAVVRNIGEAIADETHLRVTQDGVDVPLDSTWIASTSISAMETVRFDFTVPPALTEEGGRTLRDNVRVWVEDRASGQTCEVWPPR